MAKGEGGVYHSLSPLLLGSGGWGGKKLGERLRGVPEGGEAMWECRDLFIEVNSECW